MSLTLTPETLAKYDVAGPRYTSYPTVPVWKSKIDQQAMDVHLQRVGASVEPLSLYIHIPFCQSLCTYCGCNVAIRKPFQKYGDEYLDILQLEFDKIKLAMNKTRELQQLHWGGGTPTFLSEAQMERLMNMIKSVFTFHDRAEVAIEIEPRTVTLSSLSKIKALGFNRVSMGVQDFDEKVQQAVNRVHSYEKIKEITEICRDLGFSSINMDLIYGLPHQTLSSFNDTIEKILALKPNRVALYSFAHIPWIKKHQKKIDVDSLPSSEAKVDIFLAANRALTEGPYQAIAMDHFALEDDEMALAYREGRLNRNFMGYTVLPGQDFLGCGVSSISYIQGAFFQNHKDLPVYQEMLGQEQWPQERQKVLSADDHHRRAVIHDLMCKFELDTEDWEARFQLKFEEVFGSECEHLEHCIEDGLLVRDERRYEVTELGKLFVRNIAMGFDAYLGKEQRKTRFSKVI